MESAMNNGMCRCCASEGTFKDVKTKYSWMGQEEIYADMLKECFDINLIEAEDGDNGGICEVCVTQLRNAANFKKQVLHTEEQFKKHLDEKLFSTNIVKLEIEKDDALESDNNMSDDYSAPEFEVPIKEEKPEETKPKKRAAAVKATTSKAKKAKVEVGETSKPKSNMQLRLNRKSIIRIERHSDEEDDRELRLIAVKKRNKTLKHQQNIRTVLLNTNATPIRYRNGVGYACCFCKNQYPDPADLKTHTIKDHDEKTKSTFMENAAVISYVVKLDITNLCCNVCNQSIEELEQILEHLRKDHNKIIHVDIKNQILPFKFDNANDMLRCVNCSQEFNNFKILQEHMNNHYRNFICEICGDGFVHKRALQLHCFRHVKGEFQCDHCPKIFDAFIRKREHERNVHINLNRRNKCGYCGEKFTHYLKKNSHEIIMHGVKPLLLKCHACDKTFDNQRKLTIHKKANHTIVKKKKEPL